MLSKHKALVIALTTSCTHAESQIFGHSAKLAFVQPFLKYRIWKSKNGFSFNFHLLYRASFRYFTRFNTWSVKQGTLIQVDFLETDSDLPNRLE